jgi:hypothetical protein
MKVGMPVAHRIARVLSALSLMAALADLPAYGHAVIVSSQPTSGETVSGATVPLMLRFNSRIDRRRSRLALVAPGGQTAVLSIETALGPDILSANAVGLRPGRYWLHWQVMSIDGHITRGDIPFDVMQ